MNAAAFLEDIMRPSFRTIVVSTLTLIVSSTLASAAEVRVLSVGSTQIAAKAIAAEFERETGHKVTFTIRPPFNIDKELAEKTFDAVILSVPAMDNHDEAGDLAPVAYRLYLPKEWASDRKRRRKVGVPDEIGFKTKPEIALAQIHWACYRAARC